MISMRPDLTPIAVRKSIASADLARIGRGDNFKAAVGVIQRNSIETRSSGRRGDDRLDGDEGVSRARRRGRRDVTPLVLRIDGKPALTSADFRGHLRYSDAPISWTRLTRRHVASDSRYSVLIGGGRSLAAPRRYGS